MTGGMVKWAASLEVSGGQLKANWQIGLGNPGNPNKVIMDIYGYFTKKNAVMREIGAQYVIISTHHERNGIGID